MSDGIKAIKGIEVPVVDGVTLTFDRQKGLDYSSYYAELSFVSSAFDHRGYLVYEWKGRWAVSREAIPALLGDAGLQGTADTLRQGVEACVEDARQLHRLRCWQQYMRTHYPPGMDA